VVLIDAATLCKAEKLIESCEHCNPEGAEIPFDNILDRVTGSDPSVTDYILEVPTGAGDPVVGQGGSPGKQGSHLFDRDDRAQVRSTRRDSPL